MSGHDDLRGTAWESGFSLPEILTVTVLLGIIFVAVMSILSSSWRQTRFGYETADQVREAALIFRILEDDMRGAMATGTRIHNAVRGGPVILPSPESGTQGIFFWSLGRDGVRGIRYLHDPTRQTLWREVYREDGVPGQSRQFGKGIVESFRFSLRSIQGPVFLVEATFGGELTATQFRRLVGGDPEIWRNRSSWQSQGGGDGGF